VEAVLFVARKAVLSDFERRGRAEAAGECRRGVEHWENGAYVCVDVVGSGFWVRWFEFRGRDLGFGELGSKGVRGNAEGL